MRIDIEIPSFGCPVCGFGIEQGICVLCNPQCDCGRAIRARVFAASFDDSPTIDDTIDDTTLDEPTIPEIQPWEIY